MRSFCTACSGRLIVGLELRLEAMPLDTRVEWFITLLGAYFLELVGLVLTAWGGAYSLISILQNFKVSMLFLDPNLSMAQSSYGVAGGAFLISGLGMFSYGNHLTRKTKRLRRAKRGPSGNGTQLSGFAKWLGKEMAGSYKLDNAGPGVRNVGSCKFCNVPLRGNLSFCPACGRAQA